jgi:hypothetical protein
MGSARLADARGADQLMVKNAPARYTGLSSVYDFSKVRTVVDLGGGEGGLLLHLLREQEHLQGVLFDLPDVVANAPARFEAAGFTNRCKIVAGSFFDTVPTDGDVYVLANVINNFNNDGGAVPGLVGIGGGVISGLI